MPEVLVPLGAFVGAWSGGWMGRRLARYHLGRAACAILTGNRIVLEDIGRQTARFIALMHDLDAPDPARLATFLDGVRPGATTAGGQDLLRRAFMLYYTARFAKQAEQKQEAVYVANCQAVLHEHIRLQPYIKRSIPWLFRRRITRHLLTFQVGSMPLSVAEDVPVLGGEPTLTMRPAMTFTGDAGTRVTDWTDLRQRMTYVAALFRVMHNHSAVFAAP